MAVTIDATVGGANANSYVTLDEAEAYCKARLDVAHWVFQSADKKNRALVEATRDLTNLTWAGERASATQALAWPRQWAADPDSPGGGHYPTNIIPQRIKDATCELALQYVLAGSTETAAPTTEEPVLKRKKIDVLEWEYFEPTTAPARGLQRNTRVRAFVSPLLASAGFQTTVLRG